MDHVKMIDVWPGQDALANITAQFEGNGGGPYNVTKNLAKLECGFPLGGVGLIGRDADGEAILRDCKAHGIDAAAIQQTAAAPTSYTDVMTVASTGRRTFFHQQGANALLDGTHFDLSKATARICYLGYMCLLPKLDAVDAEGRTTASRLFEEAHGLGMITVADLVSSEAGDFSSVVNPSLPYLDYLFLNEYELARLVGGKISASRDRLELQLREVVQSGIRGAVIVHLPEGALCLGREQPLVWQAAVNVPKDFVVGTAGAGDAFSAGFLLGLHEEWNVQRCLELAVCVAAASLRDATCSGAIESWGTCLELGSKLGFQEC